MTMRISIAAVSLLLACRGEAATPEVENLGARPQPAPKPARDIDDDPSETSAPETLAPEQSVLLHEWYGLVGAKRDGESYGDLIARIAKHKLGVPYDDSPQTAGYEVMRVDLNRLQCVSFVEYTLAIARCTWLETQDDPCFLRELRETRYRGGIIDGYPSRLHYFTDWLEDNARRKRLRLLRGSVGSADVNHNFYYMTRHPKSYPALAESTEIQKEMRRHEARLSAKTHPLVQREKIAEAQVALEDGDLVAFVTKKPGLFVSHAGFIVKDSQGRSRVLHASSYNKRVVLSKGDVANYVLRRPERRGVIASRPEPPVETR